MQMGGLKQNGTVGPVTATTTQCHATRPMYHVITVFYGVIYYIEIEIVDSRGSFFVRFPLCNYLCKKYWLSYGLPQKYTTIGYLLTPLSLILLT